MGIYYRNDEGYSDPTAGAAFSHVMGEEKRRKKAEKCRKHVYRPPVFICSPYSGDVARNVCQARRYCRFAVLNGAIPVAPHLLFPQFLDDNNPEERELGLFFGKVLMDKCDEVWIFSDGVYSPGMRSEYARAVKRGYKIRHFTTDCQEVGSHGEGGADGSL